MTSTPWRPSASLTTLNQRAGLITKIRQFFAERGVLEVETPLLMPYSVTDPHMQVITAEHPRDETGHYYLQTSPEYAMKRLLAAGSGPIYQICKAFRKGERSRRHHPEFTMLEWYRPGFSLFHLMDEVEALLKCVCARNITASRISYRQLFLDTLDVDPFNTNCQTLERLARQHIDIQMRDSDRDDWLNLLMTELIEPTLKDSPATFIYHYPASQAALASIREDEQGIAIAQRFELYVNGLELANGYYELTDVNEQRRRFVADQQRRRQLGKPVHEMDKTLLAAMESGLPACSGVALGLDRLIMTALNIKNINEVLAFSDV